MPTAESLREDGARKLWENELVKLKWAYSEDKAKKQASERLQQLDQSQSMLSQGKGQAFQMALECLKTWQEKHREEYLQPFPDDQQSQTPGDSKEKDDIAAPPPSGLSSPRGKHPAPCAGSSSQNGGTRKEEITWPEWVEWIGHICASFVPWLESIKSKPTPAIEYDCSWAEAQTVKKQIQEEFEQVRMQFTAEIKASQEKVAKLEKERLEDNIASQEKIAKLEKERLEDRECQKLSAAKIEALEDKLAKLEEDRECEKLSGAKIKALEDEVAELKKENEALEKAYNMSAEDIRGITRDMNRLVTKSKQEVAVNAAVPTSMASSETETPLTSPCNETFFRSLSVLDGNSPYGERNLDEEKTTETTGGSSESKIPCKASRDGNLAEVSPDWSVVDLEEGLGNSIQVGPAAALDKLPAAKTPSDSPTKAAPAPFAAETQANQEDEETNKEDEETKEDNAKENLQSKDHKQTKSDDEDSDSFACPPAGTFKTIAEEELCKRVLDHLGAAFAAASSGSGTDNRKCCLKDCKLMVHPDKGHPEEKAAREGVSPWFNDWLKQNKDWYLEPSDASDPIEQGETESDVEV
eukprot:CAMPEP_0206441818 /NCGR_PEP_ID=MMETSP0324_2-20121206/13483_1 /ASSEMBLY_ACC=CAM_ASM_000836 /TAXON_ID=2866 /ORGANISM="Crypthecodinium cohnii, Strain Seligo" /LENGTH=581 /DNA_ID=CAMNT_0053909603 /DNA_START=249 /DNA_END=1994 /DNA_ORIENTATION=-